MTAQALGSSSPAARAASKKDLASPPAALAGVLREMAAATGVIGVDSGLSHMAVALDLLHVQIFSYPRAWRAGPVGHAHQVPVGAHIDTLTDQVPRHRVERFGDLDVMIPMNLRGRVDRHVIATRRCRQQPR